jgi:hypothetical protein
MKNEDRSNKYEDTMGIYIYAFNIYYNTYIYIYNMDYVQVKYGIKGTYTGI